MKPNLSQLHVSKLLIFIASEIFMPSLGKLGRSSFQTASMRFNHL